MITVKMDSKALERNLKEFTKQLGREADQAVIDIARSSCTALASRIQPFGTGTKTKDILEKAIYKDVGRVYWSTGRTYKAIKTINPRLAVAYAEATHQGDTAKASQIASKALGNFPVTTSDTGNRLKAVRNTRGRVNSTNKPVGITDKNSLEHLKAKVVLSAGNAKAGFLQAGASLKAKSRIPAWLRKAGTALGSSKIVRNGWNTIVTIYNHVKYASNVISESAQQEAIRKGYVNSLRFLEKKIEKLSKNV